MDVPPLVDPKGGTRQGVRHGTRCDARKTSAGGMVALHAAPRAGLCRGTRNRTQWMARDSASRFAGLVRHSRTPGLRDHMLLNPFAALRPAPGRAPDVVAPPY